jgi:hypothetical protein
VVWKPWESWQIDWSARMRGRGFSPSSKTLLQRSEIARAERTEASIEHGQLASDGWWAG